MMFFGLWRRAFPAHGSKTNHQPIISQSWHVLIHVSCKLLYSNRRSKGFNEVQSVTIFTHLVEAHMSIFLSLVQDQVNAFPNSESQRLEDASVATWCIAKCQADLGQVAQFPSILRRFCMIVWYTYIYIYKLCKHMLIYTYIYGCVWKWCPQRAKEPLK